MFWIIPVALGVIIGALFVLYTVIAPIGIFILKRKKNKSGKDIYWLSLFEGLCESNCNYNKDDSGIFDIYDPMYKNFPNNVYHDMFDD